MKKLIKLPNQNGFTLIELLVVVLIIGILAAIALPQYTAAVAKSRAVEGFTIGKSIVEAQERYFLQHGVFTLDFADLDIDIPTTGTGTTSMTTKNFTYTLHGTSGVGAHLWARPANSPGYTLDFYYPSGGAQRLRICNAASDNTAAQKICTSLGGKKFSSDGEGASSRHNYELN
ncbi:prepilin-type N-terminal cleavage/methylation domain-containing protein [Elusimicrobium posterum]|uniref:type IV pilin protein n=1 Tax=Elusimicrobium posterum TaxID=3116653 RepID=UPI003C783EB5